MSTCSAALEPTTFELVAQRIASAAIPLDDERVVWVQPAEDPSVPRRPLPPNLLDGSAGIALFLAAVHRVSGERPWGDLARRAVEPLRRQLEGLVDSPERAAGLRLALGGGVGLGSHLYSLLRVGLDVGDDALPATGLRTLDLLTSERVAADTRLDPLAGCAGALLATLALEQHTGDPRALEVARRCGEHLLEARVSWDGRPLAWPGDDRPPLSGFGHGASGIGYALVRLAIRLREERFLAAALEGFDFERSLFDPGLRGWLDPRTGRQVEQAAWCHGAPGIALARAATLDALKTADWNLDPLVRERLAGDLEDALDLTCAVPLLPLDHLCCGNAGQIEILALLGELTGRSELVGRARALATAVLDVVDDGSFRFRSDDLTLFHGLSGIGWSLLRLESNGACPSPLLLATSATPSPPRGHQGDPR